MSATRILIFVTLIQAGQGFFANLCFNEQKKLNCSYEGKYWEGGRMSILSVTLLLSSDERDLKASQENGESCKAVPIDCQVPVRPSSDRAEFHDTMLSVYDYIFNSCDDKLKCAPSLPPYTAINGTNAVCLRRYPNVQSLYFRGAFIDIGCGHPEPTTTVNLTDTDIANNGSITESLIHNSTAMPYPWGSGRTKKPESTAKSNNPNNFIGSGQDETNKANDNQRQTNSAGRISQASPLIILLSLLCILSVVLKYIMERGKMTR